MIKKNEEYVDTVEDFGSEGEGIIKRENAVVFVPFTIVGEKVKYKILKTGKTFAYAKAEEIITASEDRVKPPCEVFGKCGGCDLQHIEYRKTLEIKAENVKRCFNKIANLYPEVEKTVPSDKILRYRNKLQLPVEETEEGLKIGFYARNSHRIIPIKDCPINPEWTKNIISAFTFYIKNHASGYNPQSGKGMIREITVKETGGALVITAVCTSFNLPEPDKLIEKLKESLTEDFSLFINVNDSKTNVIYGEKFKCLYGKEEFITETFGIKRKTGVKSFSQVNYGVCKKLYSTVAEIVSKNKNATVIDAYSGEGLLTAMLALNAKKAVGIEVVKEAVACANHTAELNGLSDKIKNYCGKCEDILPEIANEQKKEGEETILVLDPPRKGCDGAVINAARESGANLIVYISCMPSTLARDVGLITGNLARTAAGIEKVKKPDLMYKIEKIIPFDMFPDTRHVETLILLSRADKRRDL